MSTSASATPPVLLLAFARPDLLRRVLGRVREARPALLFIAVDGPRPGRADDAATTAACRAIVEEVDWPCVVRTRFLEENQGCKLAISGAISWFFAQVEEGIVLEEDCVPGAAFFPFCAALLERYRDDPRVGLVSGDNFLPEARWREEGHGFTRYAFIWGWASWRRAWEKFDRDLTDWPERRAADWLRRQSGSEAEARHWRRILDHCYVGRRYDSWAFPWMYSCWKDGMLCVYPLANLVSNVGFYARGSHTTGAGDSNDSVPARERHAPGGSPARVDADPATDRELALRYFKLRRRPFTRAARAVAAGLARAGWGTLGLLGGTSRAGWLGAARAACARSEGRPGAVSAGGQHWEFGDGPVFGAELERVWFGRRYELPRGETEPFIVDCGAGWGVATLYWARRWRAARVLALEPDPAMRARLEKNLAAAGPVVAGRVEVRAAALARAGGRASFVSMPDGRGRLVDEPGRREAAHLIAVDALAPAELLGDRAVSLVKLTIAGAEHGLFDEPAVWARVARVYVDCHTGGPRQARLEDLLARLRAAGFRCFIQAEPFAPRPFVRRGEEEGTLQRAQIYAFRD
jgi:FkbM family methyltransferase